jgi:hypothetical protein
MISQRTLIESLFSSDYIISIAIVIFEYGIKKRNDFKYLAIITRWVKIKVFVMQSAVV